MRSVDERAMQWLDKFDEAGFSVYTARREAVKTIEINSSFKFRVWAGLQIDRNGGSVKVLLILKLIDNLSSMYGSSIAEMSLDSSDSRGVDEILQELFKAGYDSLVEISGRAAGLAVTAG